MLRIILEAQANLISANNSELGEITGGTKDTVSKLTVGNRLFPLDKRGRVWLHSSVTKNRLGEIHNSHRAVMPEPVLFGS